VGEKIKQSLHRSTVPLQIWEGTVDETYFALCLEKMMMAFFWASISHFGLLSKMAKPM
jgi:hypothetical protein